MILIRRTLIACAVGASLLASSLAIAQDIKPRLIRFGYGLNEQSNQAAPPRCWPTRLKSSRAAR